MDKSFDLGALLKNHEKNRHKSKPAQFVSVAGGVQKRLEKSLINRKSSRLTVFDSLRRLSRCESPIPEPLSEAEKKVEHRRQQLEKWKQEKEKKKKEAAAHKKKPFVAGVAHAPMKYVPPPPPKPVPSTSGRVTRSQAAKTNASKNTKSNQTAVKKPPLKEAQSFAPKNAGFKAPQLNLPKLTLIKPKKDTKAINITFEPIVPNSKKSTKKVLKPEAKKVSAQTTRSTRSRAYNLSSVSETTTSSSSSDECSKIGFQSQTSSESETSPFLGFPTQTTTLQPIVAVKLLTPKNGIPKSESGSEEKLRSPKSPVNEGPMTPEEIAEEARKMSPYVTVSRGKDNARKEMQIKRAEGLLDEDASDMDSVDYFRKQLDSEVARLTHMCDTWDRISEQTVLPESILELVLSAVGQGRLLMSQKLMQFSSLVQRCAVPDPAQALVTPADLHGFWDMVFMQIENVDMRFKKLEELRSMNWIEEQPKIEKKKVTKQPVKKTSKPAGGASKLREMIAAARKAKQTLPPDSQVALASVATEKTFEAGFFSVKSPVRSPAIATPNNKRSLLKSVLSSEAKKASASKASYAMLRASLLSKNVEIDGIAPLQLTPVRPINLNATPSRSILKSTNVSTKKKSSKKSIKTVLFDDSDTEIKNDSLTDILAEEKPIDKQELTADSGLSSMDMEKEQENKENSRRKSKLMRQEALEDNSPVMTRSRRKSLNTPKETDQTPRRSSRKKKGLQEVNENTQREESQTPKRSTRRRKSGAVVMT